MRFEISNKKYKDGLNTDWGIFFNPSIIDIPETLIKCEKLFDKNVLEIKKLVTDIGDLNATYVQRFNKHLQIYGFILLPCKGISYELINSKNRLKFNISHNIYKEFVTFEIAYLENSRRVQSTDSKISNFSILTLKKRKKMIIEKELIIEGYQSFDDYQKLILLILK